MSLNSFQKLDIRYLLDKNLGWYKHIVHQYQWQDSGLIFAMDGLHENFEIYRLEFHSF